MDINILIQKSYIGTSKHYHPNSMERKKARKDPKSRGIFAAHARSYKM